VAAPEKRGGHNISLQRRHEYIGDKLGLFFTGNDYRNWGHRDEKWVEGKDGLWYFLTPDGMLYEWSGGKSPVGALASKVWRTIAGGEIEGKLVTSFGPVDGAWYYEDPRRPIVSFGHHRSDGARRVDRTGRRVGGQREGSAAADRGQLVRQG
jgi:hypothetical protein